MVTAVDCASLPFACLPQGFQGMPGHPGPVGGRGHMGPVGPSVGTEDQKSHMSRLGPFFVIHENAICCFILHFAILKHHSKVPF